MREQLDAFYMHINFFIKQNFTYPQAADIINALYTHKTLRDLLTVDDPGFAVFAQLASSPTLRDLLLDFCQIDPAIVTKPLHLIEPSAPKTLMELFERESMDEILEWLKQDQPINLVDENITRIQEKLISLIEHDQFKNFKLYLRSLSTELVHQTIHQPNTNFLDALFTADPSYITIFIELDRSTLDLTDSNQRILDTLCEVPNLFKKTLNIILENYRDSLTPDDRLAVEKALHKTRKNPKPSLQKQADATAHQGMFASKRSKKSKKEEPDLLRHVLLDQTRKSGFVYPGRNESFAEDEFTNESIISPP